MFENEDNSNKINPSNRSNLHADCENCFGLCCVALPYAASADFANDKESGKPCHHLQADFRCSIHNSLRKQGFKGCTVYECFGAGQKVSQFTFKGVDWNMAPESAKQMFDVFPIMKQLHEMLIFLNEALNLDAVDSIRRELRQMLDETERLTYLDPKSILELDVPSHRENVNKLLLKLSEFVRAKYQSSKKGKKSPLKSNSPGADLIGAKLKGADLRGDNLRGAYLIAADLRNADLGGADLIGADFRDADLSGANLTESIFLTQAQINAAKGNEMTKLPPTLSHPVHWTNQKSIKQIN